MAVDHDAISSSLASLEAQPLRGRAGMPASRRPRRPGARHSRRQSLPLTLKLSAAPGPSRGSTARAGASMVTVPRRPSEPVVEVEFKLEGRGTRRRCRRRGAERATLTCLTQ